MRKLKLTLDDIRVASFETEGALLAAGTVYANDQTQPDSTFNPCTGASCTYPPQLCRTCRCFEDEGEKQQGK